MQSRRFTNHTAALGQSKGSVKSFSGSSTTATLLPGKKEIARETSDKRNTYPLGQTWHRRLYWVLESIKDDAAHEYQPALTGLTAQSRNLALQWLQDSVQLLMYVVPNQLNKILSLNEWA